MSTYSTKQREILKEFFMNHEDAQFSAAQIVNALKNTDISVSAIYRNLAEMKENGVIKTIVKQGDRSLYYQYIDSDHCTEKIHLTCKSCGKIFHASEETEKKLLESLSANDGFSLETSGTMLSGLCSSCKGEDVSK